MAQSGSEFGRECVCAVATVQQSAQIELFALSVGCKNYSTFLKKIQLTFNEKLILSKKWGTLKGLTSNN